MPKLAHLSHFWPRHTSRHWHRLPTAGLPKFFGLVTLQKDVAVDIDFARIQLFVRRQCLTNPFMQEASIQYKLYYKGSSGPDHMNMKDDDCKSAFSKMLSHLIIKTVLHKVDQI